VAADLYRVTERDEPTARRIGAICVEKGLITQAQLDTALAVQESSGQVLGEILVSQESMTRMQLADVLGEQWQGISADSSDEPAAAGKTATGEERWDLRVLLEEAQAARAHLAQLSEELGGRLSVLETLVTGVSERLTALQAAQANSPAPGRTKSAPRASTRGRRDTTTPTPKTKPKPKPTRNRVASEPAAKKRTSSA
jgi:hypothetical protein